MNSHLTRRRFLGQAAVAGTIGVPLFVRSSAGGQSPNEKLDIAVIGCPEADAYINRAYRQGWTL